MFYPKDLGAITKDIVVEDENGDTITKTIIKSEFKKNIIIWDFENKSNNDDLKWLETSFPSTIGVDLAQDYYIVDQTAYANMKAKDMGFSLFTLTIDYGQRHAFELESSKISPFSFWSKIFRYLMMSVMYAPLATVPSRAFRNFSKGLFEASVLAE